MIKHFIPHINREFNPDRSYSYTTSKGLIHSHDESTQREPHIKIIHDIVNSITSNNKLVR